MPSLHIALLGSFQVTLADRPITAFESDKVRALLAYLAVETDQPHRREHLAALLWPDVPEAAARGNLRHALANLRRTIGDSDAQPPFLHVTRQTIQFNSDCDCFVDTAVFLAPAATTQTRQQLTNKATLYRGEFLAGFALDDSTLFDEWAAVKREQCHQQMLQLLRDLAADHAARGEYRQALAYARQLVALEPWDEKAHRQLMRLLALTSQRAAALSQYDRCRQILDDELSVHPTTTTKTLYKMIRDGDWPTAVDRLPLPPFVIGDKAAPPEPVFVAREAELTQLYTFLQQARSQRSRIVFVTGEAGSGKTMLLHAFAHKVLAADPSLLVATGKCSAYTGSGDPYQPFLDVMSMLTADVTARWEAGDVGTSHARRLWAALPAVGAALVSHGRHLLDRFTGSAALLTRMQVRTRHQSPDEVPWRAQLADWVKSPPAAMPVAQADLFTQFTGLLTTLSQRHTLLLLLDDLQWIDNASLNLLFHLGQHLASRRILVVGAYRPGDVARGRDGQPHPLGGLVTELRQRFGANQIDLAQAGGRPFIDALLDSEPNRLDGQFRQELLRHTNGQALFTVELLRGLQARGDLVQDANGCWRPGASLDWHILPHRVEAAVARRIAQLSDGSRKLLTVASVEGETFTMEVAARVLQEDEADTARCFSEELGRQHRLVTAVTRHFAGQQSLSRYRFHHFLFQRYLYNTLDAVERAHLHGAVAEAMEALYATDEHSLAANYGRLAWHFQEAGAPIKAAQYCQTAGERAWRLSAIEEAISHYRQGLTLLETLPESNEKKQLALRLQMGLAKPLQASLGFAAPEVMQCYDQAYLLSQQVGEDKQLIAVLNLLGSYYLTSGQYRISRNLAVQVLSLVQRFDHEQQAIPGWLGLSACDFLLGDFERCQEELARFIACLDFRRQSIQPSDTGIDIGVNGLIWAALVYWLLGYPTQAKAYSQEAIRQAQVLAHPFSQTAALEVGSGILYIFMRDYENARHSLTASRQLAAAHSFVTFQIESSFYLCYLTAVQGEPATDLAQMETAVADWRATGMTIMATAMLGYLAEAQGLCGQAEAGLTTIAQALADVNDMDERFFLAELYRIRGDLLMMCGAETAVVESAYRQAITIAQQQAAKSWELRAALHLAMFWQKANKSREAHSLLHPVYDWFTEGLETPDLQAAETLLTNLELGME